MANGLLAKNGLIVTGSVEVQNAVTASTFSGDGSGLSGVSDFPYTGSAVISGSLEVIGNTNFTGSINFLNNSSNRINFENAASITQPQIRLRTHNTGITMRGNDVLALVSNGAGMIGMKKTAATSINFPSAAKVGFTTNTSVEAYNPETYFRRYSSGVIGIGYGAVTSANLSGSLILTNITASGHVSASTYYGDGSNLTGIETDPFPYTGSAVISGSLDITGSLEVSNPQTSSQFVKVEYNQSNDYRTRLTIDGPRIGTWDGGGEIILKRSNNNPGDSGTLLLSAFGSTGNNTPHIQSSGTELVFADSLNPNSNGGYNLGLFSRRWGTLWGNNLDIKSTTTTIPTVTISGSNDLTNNYALKVANSSGTDILAVENDGNTTSYKNLIQQNLSNNDNQGIRFQSENGTYKGYLQLGHSTTPYDGRLYFPHSATIQTNGSSKILNLSNGTQRFLVRPDSGFYSNYNSAFISAGHLGSFGFYTYGATHNMPVMRLHNRSNNDNYGVKLVYESGSVEYDGITLDRDGDVEIPNGSLNVVSSITSSNLNLNDGQSNIIVSNQSLNLDSTSDNNIIIGLGAAQSMSGSGADRNIIIGTNAAKELSKTNSRYNTIIGYNAFSDHSGSNSSQHTIIGYQAGLGMSSAGYPGNTVIIGANAKSKDSFRSMAIGAGAISGYDGHAIGYQANATGSSALAIGPNSNAATSATVIGNGASAIASSIAIGRNVDATAGESINIGSSGNSYRGILIGKSAQGTGNQGVAVGYGVGNGNFSVTLGYEAGKWNTNNSNISIGYRAMLGVSGSTNVANTIAIGYQALTALTTGTDNLAVGKEAGRALTTGGRNVLIGTLAGHDVNNSSNVMIGYQAGDGYAVTFGGYNIFVGHGANGAGQQNVAIGGIAYGGGDSIAIGLRTTTGTNAVSVGMDSKAPNQGVSIGYEANRYNSAGGVFVGYQAGKGVSGQTGASGTVALGHSSLRTITSGDLNTAIGHQSGMALTTGGSNILIGYQAGSTLTTESNKLYIENSNSTTPLIYGEFDNDLVRINGSLETNGTQRSLYTTQSFQYSGSNLTHVTTSFENGTEEIKIINYTGSNVDNIVISGSDGINKIYTLSYDGDGNVTNIIVS